MSRGWLRRTLALSALVPILTVGFARIEDGAHWPSDVLGGYMLGCVWLAITIQLYRWARRRSWKRSSVFDPARTVLSSNH